MEQVPSVTQIFHAQWQRRKRTGKKKWKMPWIGDCAMGYNHCMGGTGLTYEL